jgi:hypothetical protein
MQTEGERIFNRVRELLQTVPPDDKLAPLAGSYIGLLDSVLDQKGLGSLCDFCEAPATFVGRWNMVSVRHPSRLRACDIHRARLGDCDRMLEYART